MTEALLDRWCCPDDGGTLSPETPEGLACTLCGRRFHLTGGIARMLPSPTAWTGAERGQVERERAQRDREAPSYDALAGLRLLSLVEIPATLGPLAITAQDRVLEVGCGTGRVTRRLARAGAAVLAVDHSLESLRLLEAALDGRAAGVVQLVEADASRLPVRTGWATCAVASQVLMHLPTPALRGRAVAELARALAPGGRLAVSVYRRLPGLPAEGRHSGEIFFRRFTRDEMVGLLEPHFRVTSLTGWLGYVWLAHARR